MNWPFSLLNNIHILMIDFSLHIHESEECVEQVIVRYW